MLYFQLLANKCLVAHQYWVQVNTPVSGETPSKPRSEITGPPNASTTCLSEPPPDDSFVEGLVDQLSSSNTYESIKLVAAKQNHIDSLSGLYE